jgi:ATP-binding cassette subfamily E protein 1
MPPKSKKGDKEEQSAMTRIAVVNADRCKPKKCSLECKKCCPIVLQGKLCVEVTNTSPVSIISEELCIGCGLCVKRCPYQAIDIINLPSNLDRQTTHRYGPNSFKLHRLPLPRPGQVLGLIGATGTGKSTALNILKGKIKPNLGKYRAEPSWEDIMKYFRGSEHQAYFQHLLEDKIKAIIKPQYVDQVPKAMKGQVETLIRKADERGMADKYLKDLDLLHKLDSTVDKLSGGELQRFTIALVCVQKASVYMYDEPSSYLDVRQRLTAANVIRAMVTDVNYVITVEHDLAVVDYMSDFVCVLYGRPNTYGIVTLPYGVREGINIFLEGFVPTENLRFRTETLSFNITQDLDELSKRVARFQYPKMEKSLGGFRLRVDAGEFNDSEIVVLLGENGCGKTTLIRMLAGFEKPDNQASVPQLAVSYKPQKIDPKFQGTVKDLLQTKILASFNHAQFVADVLKPLNIDELIDMEVQHLSGGQRQRVAITLALGQTAHIYLLDEPSAYLDSDQRIIASKVIKRFVMHTKKTAFVVEHDFIMATYLADRVVVYDGVPGVDSHANAPCSLLEGMNKFLKSLDITFRRDPTNYCPRINKLGSQKDQEQKAGNNYFYMQEPVVVDAVQAAAKAKAALVAAAEQSD